MKVSKLGLLLYVPIASPRSLEHLLQLHNCCIILLIVYFLHYLLRSMKAKTRVILVTSEFLSVYTHAWNIVGPQKLFLMNE